MPKLTQCPDIASLQRLALNQVDGTEDESLHEHLIRCKRCFQMVQQLRKTGGVIPDELKSTVNPDRETAVDLRGSARDGDVAHSTVEYSRQAAFNESGAAVSEGSVDGKSMLGPPYGPGEIGRLGQYRVVKLLGEGGMGFVYQAQDTILDRLVALKVMKPDRAATAIARNRFLQEAKSAAAFQHDNIVTIYQVGEERGVLYMAMQFLLGEPLDQRLDRDGALSLNDILRIGREAAEGLAAAHARGLIHRDIKPANIWLEKTESGVARVKILDFGLARSITDPSQKKTQTGVIMGTPGFMAPEQAHGEAVDERCDLFSLGCVFYQMCTGREPFRRDDLMATLMALAMEEPTPIRELNPQIPHFLVELVGQMMAKDRDDRPDAARTIASTLSTAERTFGKGPTPRSNRFTNAAAFAAPPPSNPFAAPAAAIPTTPPLETAPRAFAAPKSTPTPSPLEQFGLVSCDDTEEVNETTPTNEAAPLVNPAALTTPGTKPDSATEIGPCPKCGAVRTSSAIKGWCLSCGYHPELDQKTEEVKEETKIPYWLWVILGGIVLVIVLSFVASRFLPRKSEIRAWWEVGQLGIGLVAFIVAQIWGFLYTLSEGTKLGLTTPLKLWGVVLKSMPVSRHPVYLGSWSFTLMLCAILVIGGHDYWLDQLKRRRAPKTGSPPVAGASGAAKSPEQTAEEFDDMVEFGNSPQDLSAADKDAAVDQDLAKLAEKTRYTDTFTVVGYISDVDGSAASLVLAVSSGGSYDYVGIVGNGMEQADRDKVRQFKTRARSVLPNSPINAQWLEPTETCVVEYGKYTARGTLQDAVFKKW